MPVRTTKGQSSKAIDHPSESLVTRKPCARRSRATGSKKLQVRAVAQRFVCCNLRPTEVDARSTVRVDLLRPGQRLAGAALCLRRSFRARVDGWKAELGDQVGTAAEDEDAGDARVGRGEDAESERAVEPVVVAVVGDRG